MIHKSAEFMLNEVKKGSAKKGRGGKKVKNRKRVTAKGLFKAGKRAAKKLLKKKKHR